jgi:hypothetical protein
MLSIQYYPFGCQNGQRNRQHASLRIMPDSPTSLLPLCPFVLSILLSKARSRHRIAQRQDSCGAYQVGFSGGSGILHEPASAAWRERRFTDSHYQCSLRRWCWLSRSLPGEWDTICVRDVCKTSRSRNLANCRGGSCRIDEESMLLKGVLFH